MQTFKIDLPLDPYQKIKMKWRFLLEVCLRRTKFLRTLNLLTPKPILCTHEWLNSGTTVKLVLISLEVVEVFDKTLLEHLLDHIGHYP